MQQFWLNKLVRIGLLAGALVFASVSCVPRVEAQKSPMFGDWKEPAGSVIRIGPCPSGVCFWLEALAPNAPGTTDVHNPDAAQRGRKLRGLEIGSQFELVDSTHAAGGLLYDPRSGRTYRGAIILDGDTLKLRGYIGLPIFGRTETWRRVSPGS